MTHRDDPFILNWSVVLLMIVVEAIVFVTVAWRAL